MIEPNNTCPAIDEIKASSSCIIDSLNEALSKIKGAQLDAEDIYNEIESLRDANQGLREWGTYWEEESKELQSKVDDLEEEIEELKND